MKKFKPLLAPNQEINLDELSYPILASTKLDGIRVIFYKGKILTRSLKALPNKQLNQKFEPIRQYSEDYNLILDGEIYAHDIPFQFIISCFMTQDYENKLAIKKWDKLCEEHDFYMTREEVFNRLKFYCFDCVENDNFDKEFSVRVEDVYKVALGLNSLIIPVRQNRVSSKEEIEAYFDKVLKDNYEGLILRSLDGRYKCGRGTIKEGIIYKVKPFRTFDAKIIDVIQSTEVNEDAEKKMNELGRSVTSKKKNDRHLIDKASAFLVNYEDKELKVTLAMTDEEKEEVWKNKENYIGRTIEYKGMLVGAKDVPRHPVMIRFRNDKDN